MKAHQEGRRVVVTSLDLGISEVDAIIEPGYVMLSPDITLPVEVVEEIARDRNACFPVEKGKAKKIQMFSEHANLFYSLLPTDSAPTLMISGVPMHRVHHANPYLDTQSKLKALGRISGHVLDTCTGLGHTAIRAAMKAASVVTVELDPVVLELARLNPWSRQLFDNPKIHKNIGDIVEEIEDIGNDVFSSIIHDPPTIRLAGDLYSADFYWQLYRVLRPKGRLYHYVGDPNGKLGRNTARGVALRLREAGFIRVKYKHTAFGLVAGKSTCATDRTDDSEVPLLPSRM